MHIYLLNQTADGFIELYQTVSSKMKQKKGESDGDQEIHKYTER